MGRRGNTEVEQKQNDDERDCHRPKYINQNDKPLASLHMAPSILNKGDKSVDTFTWRPFHQSEEHK